MDDPELDLAYAPDLALDVYGAANTKGAVVLIHGGGWFQGDKRKEAPLAARLAQAGYVVFAPNYGLTPRELFPHARDEILACATWAQGSRYCFDRNRLAFWGGSAGGNLAVEAALATGRPAVSWSGLLDLEGAIAETEGAPAAPPDPGFGAQASAAINQTGRDDTFLRWCILRLVGGDGTKLAAATPSTRVTAACGPIYMANSTDEFVHATDPIRMQAALGACGVESVVHLLPGKRHGEGYADDEFAPSFAFLDARLGLA